MINVNITVDSTTAMVEIDGRVDSNSVSELEASFEKSGVISGCSNCIFNLEKTEYISSAGLRFFLKVQKDGLDVQFINASSEVYNIFDVTGFRDMFPVQRALRRMSVDGCEIIGQGANSIVYRIDSDIILKLYIKGDVLPEVKAEQAHAKYALRIGIPTAISYDVVKVEDKYGSVFELVDAQSIAGILRKDVSLLNEYIPVYASVLKSVHEIEYVESKNISLPRAKDKVLSAAVKIKEWLPVEMYDKLYSKITQMPEGDTMIHGDSQPNNLMVTKDEVLFIDMDTMAVGDPIFEFGALYAALIGYAYYSDNMEILGISNELSFDLWHGLFDEYYKDISSEEKEKKLATCKLISAVQVFKKIAKYTDKYGQTAYDNSLKDLIECISE
ncbi:MAG: phosphotransferase [Lachnospiraceae bacterium]|nr:phosphotransferase [Candidatus Merdinaster equi]